MNKSRPRKGRRVSSTVESQTYKKIMFCFGFLTYKYESRVTRFDENVNKRLYIIMHINT